jgi:predicted CxxxxCH...CXXCH cytochrome family protein
MPARALLVLLAALTACSGSNAVEDAGRPDAAPDAEVITTCSASCHGGAANAAPPLSLKGTTGTSERGVGAHQVHLRVSDWRAPVTCEDCHRVPRAINAKFHIDTAVPAELTFSALASSGGMSPDFDGTTCSGVYCHGATLSGGDVAAPTWTRVDGSQTTCSSCHGLPPKDKHSPTDVTCALCHGSVVDGKRKIIALKLHIDGKISSAAGHPAGYSKGDVHGPDFFKDRSACEACHGKDLTGGVGKSCDSCHTNWKTNCVFCHGGTDNKTGAPPEAVAGQTATSVPAVGQHTSHVTAGASHAAYGCELCHTKPTDALSAGHIDGAPAQVSFAKLAGPSASYSAATNLCSSVYCHGNGKTAQGGAPWIGKLTGGCSACHDDETDGGTMTLSGNHKKHLIDKGYACVDCHGCITDSAKKITATAKHVDGVKDVCGVNLNWSSASRTCKPACHTHGNDPW